MQRIMILFLALICIAVLVVFYGFYSLRSHTASIQLPTLEVSDNQEKQDLVRTKELLNNSQIEEALTLIHQHELEINSHTEVGREWLNLLVRASETTFDREQLKTLYEYYPKAFEAHEKGSLLIAQSFLVQENGKEYKKIRDLWKGRESRPEDWLILDADQLLAEQKPKDAIDLLSSRAFQGKNDTPRLIRLAFIHAPDNPKAAWDYLTQALLKDPENPEIRSYRAKLLEASGKPTLALAEYQAALQTDVTNLYLKDQLADFYVRSHQFGPALQLWSENLLSPTVDFVWMKAWFWNRVFTPLPFAWSSSAVPQGRLEPLVSYLVSLKPDEFWNTQKFEQVPGSADFLKSQQLTFWLRLFDALKNGKEQTAIDILQFSPFEMVSWNPQLEKALLKVLTYRQTGHLSSHDSKEQAAMLDSSVHPLYEQLNTWTNKEEEMPAGLQDLLKGPEAFSATLIAAGWPEAGLHLHQLAFIPENYPEWVAIGLSQSYVDRKQYNDAIEIIVSHPYLAISITGLEMLARIALLQDDTPKAEKIYQTLEPYSFEAKSFLAHKAFADQDWQRARELTEQLLMHYPSNKLLQENLEKIVEQQK